MRAQLSIDKVDDLMATMKVTMKVSEWRVISKRMGEEWPDWAFAHLIDKLIGKATSAYDESTDETP